MLIGENFGRKRGRPVRFDPKTIRKEIRISEDDLEMLADLRKETGLSDSEIMRRALRDYHMWKVFGVKPW